MSDMLLFDRSIGLDSLKQKLARLKILETRLRRFNEEALTLKLSSTTGSDSTSATLAILSTPQNEVSTRIQEVVLDLDDRVQILDTTQYPWRCICLLRITTADGKRWSGTGWLAGPRTIITAGHCVYHRRRGGWAQTIEVIPGCNGTYRPYGSCITTAVNFRSVTGWIEQSDDSLTDDSRDYGAIILPAEYPYGRHLGFFRCANNIDNSILQNLTLNLSGYPVDKQPLFTQWIHQRRVGRIMARTFEYQIDTAGGQSGSPVWFVQDGNRYAVGIHTNGAQSGNSATRITSSVFNNITSWIAEGT